VLRHSTKPGTWRLVDSQLHSNVGVHSETDKLHKRRQYQKIYQVKNRERLKTYQQLYQRSNKENLRTYRRSYVVANKDRLQLLRRQYEAKKKRELHAYHRSYEARNKEKRKMINKRYNMGPRKNYIVAYRFKNQEKIAKYRAHYDRLKRGT
jgi:hypothetical protein